VGPDEVIGSAGGTIGTVRVEAGVIVRAAWVRRAMLALWDSMSWILAALLIVGLRHDFRMGDVQWASVTVYVVTAIALTITIGYASRLYRGLFRVGSFSEMLGLVALFGGVGVIELGIWTTVNRTLPRSIPVLAPMLALLIAAAGRWAYRALRERSRSQTEVGDRRTLIYGAGDAGAQVLTLLQKQPSAGMEVVGFIDDNPGLRHRRLRGVPVVATRENLAERARELRADVVILAYPGADRKLIDEIDGIVRGAGMEFLVLPRLSELSGGQVALHDLRDVAIEDILGRREVATSLSGIARYLGGRRVLVTGAGGSIGSELCRQIRRFGPSSLVMLDRDESALHAVQLSIFGHGLLNSPDTVLVDIRDEEACRKVFEASRPEIVFHAAALKHLPMLERFPEEGWKTNVLGTLNILQLAGEYGVEHFVNISTDKAAEPTSVLGTTKRLAERLTAWQAERLGKPYISVRFGNVLGSRGSVLHSFAAQIARGGPVTVTDPDVTRYFMTIAEACELVTQAGAIGQPGHVMVLDMGEPVTILSVAERMIAMSGKRDVQITFTGLRPGEKLHEELFGGVEDPEPTEHPLIRSVYVPPLDPAELALCHDWNDPHQWDQPMAVPSSGSDAPSASRGSSEPASSLPRSS
jgi:FlaA1/EpsC-like NDP-sugar epimerase